MRRVCQCVALPVLFLVLYLALRPGSSTATAPFFPRWLGDWLDAHDDLKNVLGFWALTWVTLQGFRSHSGWRPRTVRDAVLLLGLLGLVCGLELAQKRIPDRIPDPYDVVMGVLGVGLGWCTQWRPRRQ